MKKRGFTMLLALCMIVSLLPLGAAAADIAASGTCGEALTWTLDENGLLTISGTGPMQDYTAAAHAPYWPKRYQIYKVVLEAGVTTIGKYAFYDCSSLTSITIPNSVSRIGEWAFYDCSSLTSVAIPEGVTGVAPYTFYSCSGLAGVTIPDGVTSIGSNAFSGCCSLKSVELPDSVRHIDGAAFGGCSSLTSIKIPDGVTQIVHSAFAGCSSLKDITIPDGVTGIGDYAFHYCSSLMSVKIPEGVTSIGASAFSQCRSLKSIVIPDSVTSIGEYAFYACSSLTSVTIPTGVTRIDKGALENCTSLTALRLSGNIREIAEKAFRGADLLRDVFFCGSEADWNAITIRETGNVPLKNATIHFHSHILTKVDAKAPTCTEHGWETYWECSFCGKLFSDAAGARPLSDYPILPAGHRWDGGTIIKQPTESAAGVIAFTCSVCGETRTVSVRNPFTDVKNGDYFFHPVLWALTHDPKITDGTSDTTFSPDATCTRGQVVTFLWRSMGCPEPKSTKNPFQDVKQSDYFYKAVLWAVEQGITDGTSDTTFSPEAPCTRAHVVTFLWRAEHKPDAGSRNPFTDVASGQYYTAAVLWAVSEGITDGTSETAFSPDAPCTRGQIVTFLYRDMK